MGDPKKKRKNYETPRKQWDKQLLEKERKLVDNYGLRNKRGLRKVETWLKYKRKNSRALAAMPAGIRKQRQDELINSLKKYGLVGNESTIDDVLSLKIEAVLERRLETMVLRKGLAGTARQARQFITHGHIAINAKKVSAPGYMVKVEEEKAIGWYRKPIKTGASEARDMKKEFEESKGTEEEAPQAPEENIVETAKEPSEATGDAK